ncbi:MAG: PhzF family phenazine biosynthesis protein [Cyanobacteria bacterium P01_A01_bin.17]
MAARTSADVVYQEMFKGGPMRYRFFTVDVFTERIFGGNPLAVFPEAQGLNPAQMQQIARELSLSETAFVFPPETPEGTHRLRIFTPGIELPFAGHPTIGSACVLAKFDPTAQAGMKIVFEEGVGAISVDVTDGQIPFAQFSAAEMPEFGPPPPSQAELAALLSLQPSDLSIEGWSPQSVSCGVPFLFIPLCDRPTLSKAHLDLLKWKSLLADYWAPHVYVFTPEPEVESADFRARMFAPAMDIQEDPATGAAVTAFAGYLGRRKAATSGTFRWAIEQGVEMGRPSLLRVEADLQNGEFVAIRVGGHAVMVSQGEMTVPLLSEGG